MTYLLPPLKPIPIKDRLSILYIGYGNLDVLDGAFVVAGRRAFRQASVSGPADTGRQPAPEGGAQDVCAAFR